MLANIAYYPVFGKPLILYWGVLTLTSFLLTALIGFLNYRGIHKIPFRWHLRLAILSISLGIIHGTLGILANSFR